MNVDLIGKTLSPLMFWDGSKFSMPGKAKDSKFEEREKYGEVLYGYYGGQTLIEFAGRLCYESFDRPNEATNTNSAYFKNLIRQGHESVLEHVSVSFYVEGVSRNLTHELIRHRHLSFSELSQRFVNMEDANVVNPPAEGGGLFKLSESHKRIYQASVKRYMDQGLSRKQAREAARYGLPAGVETKIVVTGNLRAWRDVLKKRYTKYADAEMQELAREVHAILLDEYPDVFEDIKYGE